MALRKLELALLVNQYIAFKVLMQCNAQATWAGMEGVADKGLARSIGISNFSPEKIERWFKDARIPPAVNQVSVLAEG